MEFMEIGTDGVHGKFLATHLFIHKHVQGIFFLSGHILGCPFFGFLQCWHIRGLFEALDEETELESCI